MAVGEYRDVDTGADADIHSSVSFRSTEGETALQLPPLQLAELLPGWLYQGPDARSSRRGRKPFLPSVQDVFRTCGRSPCRLGEDMARSTCTVNPLQGPRLVNSEIVPGCANLQRVVRIAFLTFIPAGFSWNCGTAKIYWHAYDHGTIE